MRESANTGQLVANMVKTERDTHILYRDYGLAETDESTVLTRTSVQSEISKYYPGAYVKSLTLNEVQADGSFQFNIDVEERA